MKKALNTWTLSGLMIGPILGSGIVFLPPLAYDALQNYAFVAWITMMALGGLFAYLFAKMTVMTNSNEGMSLMVGRMLGGGLRELSSNCLTAAVFFGPVPVAKTAASFLHAIIPMLSEPVLTVLVLLAIYGLVASGMYAMGRLILLLSTATALLLIGGSIATLMSAPVPALPQGQLDLRAMGNTLLLLFWAIIGWEMLANYIEEVNDPAHTILRAMKISLVSIITIYLLTTFALQTYFQAHPGVTRIQPLLYPLMGRYANLVFSLLAAALCICTAVSAVGAVSRQLRARSSAGLLPAFLNGRFSSLLTVVIANAAVLCASLFGALGVETMVSIANTFFIGNALLGLAAGFLYFPQKLLKASVAVLMAMLLLLLLFSKPFALILFAALTGWSLFRYRSGRVKNGPVEETAR